MLSAQKLSELLAALHSAPLEESNWQVFLTELCEITTTAYGACIAIDVKQGRPHVLALGGLEFDPDVQAAYNRHYGKLDPYSQPFHRRARSTVLLGEELVRRDDLENTEFYNDFLTDIGLHHAAMLPGVITPSRLELISLWRGSQQGPFDRESREFLNLLLPHLNSALQVRHALTASRMRAMRAEAALDVVPTASFILSASGGVLHMNAAAESLIRSQDGIGILNHRLIVIDATAQTKLNEHIASAAIASGACISAPGGTVALPRPSGKRPLHARIFPLRVPLSAVPAHVLVQITDAEAATRFPGCTLAALFQLTPTEAEIANALLAGLSIESIAELRRVTAGTLRVQLKTIFQKTNTRRQSELIRLLMSLPRSSDLN